MRRAARSAPRCVDRTPSRASTARCPMPGSTRRSRLRADLPHVSGSRRERSVVVGRGGIGDQPDPTSLRIVRDGAGFTLLRLDAHGVSVSHTWHPSLEAAKDAAAEAFGVGEDAWRDDAR